MKTLNEFEVMTLHEALKKERLDPPQYIILRARYSECRKNLPVLCGSALIDTNHLKFAGAIVLTEKGRKAAEKLDASI